MGRAFARRAAFRALRRSASRTPRALPFAWPRPAGVWYTRRGPPLRAGPHPIRLESHRMPPAAVSEIFDPEAWEPVSGFSFRDITYHRARQLGAVRVAFHRPEVRNAFRPQTVDELYTALEHART